MPLRQTPKECLSSNEINIDLKDYCNIIHMKSSKIYCNQLDTSPVIANILCKTYIPVVSMGYNLILWIKCSF